MMYPQPTNNQRLYYPQYYPSWPDQEITPTWNFQYNYSFSCPHCGVWLTAWSKFCPQCGKPLYETPTEEQTLEEIKGLLEKIQEKADSLSETKITEGDE